MTPAQLARFDAKVHIEPNSGCWLWMGSADPLGYGFVGTGDGKVGRSHRVSYAHHVGPIPPGLCVLHKCDTPACCNPDHLFLGTKLDNSTDMIAKGRCRSGVRQRAVTHCPRGHEYDEENTFRTPVVQWKPNGSRMCRACGREKAREKRARLVAARRASTLTP